MHVCVTIPSVHSGWALEKACSNSFSPGEVINVLIENFPAVFFPRQQQTEVAYEKISIVKENIPSFQNQNQEFLLSSFFFFRACAKKFVRYLDFGGWFRPIMRHPERSFSSASHKNLVKILVCGWVSCLSWVPLLPLHHSGFLSYYLKRCCFLYFLMFCIMCDISVHSTQDKTAH